ncbi:MAG: FAD binding domain-containing protein [Spirochaetota bacterium]
MLHEFEYARPAGKAELLELLARHGKAAKILAGGTDLLVNIRSGVSKPAIVIDIKKVRDLPVIAWNPKVGLAIGPAATINELLAHPAVRGHYTLLAGCGQDLASYQVRNRATVIGNVVNASPCSDMAPALLCLGARAIVSSRRGEREVPFSEFFTGVKKTVLLDDEILESIVVPASSADARGSYHKLKRINGHDLGIVGVALMKKDGTVALGISSAAPTPVLVEGLHENDPVDKAVAAARAATNPISDLRCSKEYREFMIEVFVRRLWAEVK